MNSGRGFRPVIIGQFGPPVLACLRSWGRQGWTPGFVWLAGKGNAPPASRYLDDWIRLDPGLLHTEKGLLAVRAYLESFNADGLLCIQEDLAMWLDRNRDFFKGFSLWLPPAENVQRVLSKSCQIEAAGKAGLSNLPTYYLDKRNSSNILHSVPEDHIPLCVRPGGEGGVVPNFKVEFIETPGQGLDFIRNFEIIEKPLIAQPYKNLPNLVVHGARSADGSVYGLQGFLVARKFQGLTLTIRALDLPGEVGRGCRDFIRELDIVGNFHFEFLYDPVSQDAYFMEINTRLGGTTAKVFSCGYDEPVLALQAFGEEVVLDDRVRNCTASSKLALMKYLYYTVAGRITPLDYPIESKWKRFGNTLRGLAFYRDDIISFRDLKGTLAFYRQALLGKISFL